MNLALLRGALSRPPELRTLASGDVLAQLQVTTRDDGVTRSVPVSLFDPPAWVSDLDTGADVVVLGAVQRRFFRGASGPTSRTEVVASKVRRANDRRACERLRREAFAALDEVGAMREG